MSLMSMLDKAVSAKMIKEFADAGKIPKSLFDKINRASLKFDYESSGLIKSNMDFVIKKRLLQILCDTTRKEGEKWDSQIHKNIPEYIGLYSSFIKTQHSIAWKKLSQQERKGRLAQR